MTHYKNLTERDFVEIENKKRLDPKWSDNKKRLQSKEETRLNEKYMEAHCGICDRYGVYVGVGADLVNVCVDCEVKYINPDAVLAVFNPLFDGYCDLHGGFTQRKFYSNISTLNMYVCTKCDAKIAKNVAEADKKGGVMEIDPVWQKICRQQNCTRKEYLQPTAAAIRATLKKFPHPVKVDPGRLKRAYNRQKKIDKEMRR